jgi:hypothetical protein
MIYLFHNVYGDANELIETKPANCEAIPFGWTSKVEAYRNQKINELKCAVSGLPSVIYFQPTYTSTIIFSTGEQEIYNFGNTWTEIRVHEMSKPWTWEKIQSEINRNKNITVNVSDN